MRFDWRHHDTGWGELLCFVLAWTIGLASVWTDYVLRSRTRSGDNVAVSGAGAGPGANLD